MYNFPGYSELRRRARNVLRTSYWLTLLVCVIFGILGGGQNKKLSTSIGIPYGLFFYDTGSSEKKADDDMDDIIDFYQNNTPDGNVGETIYRGESNAVMTSIEDIPDIEDVPNIGDVPDIDNLPPGILPDNTTGNTLDSSKAVVALGLVVLFFVIWLIIAACVIAFNCFITNPVNIGVRRFLLNAADDSKEGRVEDMFFVFRKNNNYLKNVKTMFMRDLYVGLWSLLFIIPGIIESYNLMLVPYIISDNPNIGTKEALQLSRNIMRGYKWKAFVLYWTFIGWILLCLLTCGLGYLFLTPYIQATKAQFYISMRERAIAEGMATPETFGLSNVINSQNMNNNTFYTPNPNEPFVDPFYQ